MTLLYPLLLITLMIGGCSGKKDGKAMNIEQIQAKEGIPVRTQVVVPKQFAKELLYTATLSGIEESTSRAKVSDRVVSIAATVGQSVRQDQVIVTFPSETPTASYKQAKSGYENAKQLYQRMQKLYNDGGISRQDLDNAETNYQVALANLGSSGQMVHIKAPISGVVTAINVNEADMVSPGDVLFTIAKINQMKAKIWIPESEIAYIHKGDKVSGSWAGNKFNGNISSVALSMDPDKKAFLAEVIFSNANHMLKSGISIDIKAQVLNKANAIVVDRKNIVSISGKKVVFVNENNKAVLRAITTGVENGLQVEITSGLQAGEKLITDGANMVQNGSKIKVVQ